MAAQVAVMRAERVSKTRQEVALSMNTFRGIFPAIVIATTLGTSFAVEAASADDMANTTSRQHWPRHARHAGDPFRSVLAQLGLTADQKAQIQSIYEQARPRFETLMTEARSNRETLEATAPADPGYAAALDGAKANASARLQLESDVHAQIFAVLTPAQQAQVPQLLAAERSAHEANRAQWKAQHGGT